MRLWRMQVKKPAREATWSFSFLSASWPPGAKTSFLENALLRIVSTFFASAAKPASGRSRKPSAELCRCYRD